MDVKFIMNEFDNIAKLLEQKNQDYGDAYYEAQRLFRDYPASKIFEKTKRIIQLSKEPNSVKEESLIDALRDNIGYCALYLDLLNSRK